MTVLSQDRLTALPTSRLHSAACFRPIQVGRRRRQNMKVQVSQVHQLHDERELEPDQSLRVCATALRRIQQKWSAEEHRVHSRRALIYGQSELLELAEGAGLVDAVAVCPDEEALSQIQGECLHSTLGNNKGVRGWLGELSSVPAYQGPFDVAILGDIDRLGSDLRSALLSVTLLLKPSGYILITRDTREEGQAGASASSRDAVEKVITDLPLRIDAFGGSGHSWISLLQVPDGYAFSQAPIFVEEVVVTGFGRGSKQMGVPTANLKPEALFSGPLKSLPLGVYFGWAQVDLNDSLVVKMVLNIGKRPSIEDGGQRTVELHLLHKFTADFYGKKVKAVLLGFIRPEIRFSSLATLINRINADKGIAKTQLDIQRHATYKTDSFFISTTGQ